MGAALVKMTVQDVTLRIYLENVSLLLAGG